MNITVFINDGPFETKYIELFPNVFGTKSIHLTVSNDIVFDKLISLLDDIHGLIIDEFPPIFINLYVKATFIEYYLKNYGPWGDY